MQTSKEQQIKIMQCKNKLNVCNLKKDIHIFAKHCFPILPLQNLSSHVQCSFLFACFTVWRLKKLQILLFFFICSSLLILFISQNSIFSLRFFFLFYFLFHFWDLKYFFNSLINALFFVCKTFLCCKYIWSDWLHRYQSLQFRKSFMFGTHKSTI